MTRSTARLAKRLDAALRALFVAYCHAHGSTTPPRTAWTWRSFLREQRRILDTPVGLLPNVTDWSKPGATPFPPHAPLAAYANKVYVSPLDAGGRTAP